MTNEVLDQSGENIGPSVTCIELMDASPKQLSDFKEKVKPLNGALTILIHPFFATQLVSWDRDKYVTEEYDRKRDRFLKSSFEKDNPLIIFQPVDKYSELSVDLSNYGRGTVYTVKTARYSHNPTGGDVEWNRIIDILEDADIKRVVIGGMFLGNYNLEFAKDYNDDFVHQFTKDMPEYARKYPLAAAWINKGVVPMGCAGFAAIHFLNSGIDVSLSSITTPTSGHNHFNYKWVKLEEGEEP